MGHERRVSLPRNSRSRRGMTMLEMLVVVAILSIVVAVSLPSVTAGLDSIRLASTGDAIASFLNGAVTHAERSEQPVIVVISLKEGTISADGGDGYLRRFEMPQGIIMDRVLPDEAQGVADGEEHADRQILLLPGGVAPAIGVEYFNHHGARRRVQLDPMTGFPHVENVSKE
jgi:prepilin-type N-terminal cleavage/methylation domain-containing protein